MKQKYLSIIWVITLCFACADFIEVDPPRTELVRETVFSNEQTANAALIDIYADMVSGGFASGNGFNSFTLLGSFSSDEWGNHVNPLSANQEFSDNQLLSTNPLVRSLWTDLYRFIYKANAVVEGLEHSSLPDNGIKSQLVGEATFIRAFCHFYLANLWGDVPLILSTDYRINRAAKRASISTVYDQIKQDLLASVDLLPDDYSHAEDQRVRPNRWVAKALLARVYLFSEDWINAEKTSSEIIASPNYQLSSDVLDIFKKNSEESLWQLHSNTAPKEIAAFTFSTAPSHGSLRYELVQSFAPEDERFINWIKTTAGEPIYFYARKYQSSSPVLEYTTIFRITEQYLIRAEARAEQAKLNGEESAETDLNMIRARAGLDPVSPASKEEMIATILHERRLEFLCEWGHRWLDLKRRNIVSSVIGQLKPETWQPTDELYPIPEDEILRNPSLSNAQNPGY